jgi:hypothetical protein
VSAHQTQLETRTENGELRSRDSVERPKVRSDEHPVYPPDTIWEPKEHWISHAIKALGLGKSSLTRFGAMTGVVLIACQTLRADGLDGNQKIVLVTILALTLVILGLATLLTGAKPDGANCEEQSDQSAKSGNG